MDTDSLSKECYKAILMEAEEFNHDLTLHFGVMDYHCADEQEYIEESKKLIAQIKKSNDDEIDDLFFGEPINRKKLHKALDRMLGNISNLEKIPQDKRHYDF